MPPRNQYFTPYAQWLLTKHIPSIANPRARLIEALWRRGYVALNRGSYIHLPAKLLAPHDFEDLHPILWITGVNDDSSLNLRWPKTGQIDDVIEKIILLPSARGMSRDWREGKNPDRWHVPTAEMDLGVALYVKSLWLKGIETKWSCDGHGQRNGYLEIDGKKILLSDCRETFEIAVNVVSARLSPN